MTADLASARLDAGIVANDRSAALAFWHDFLGFPVLGELAFPGMSIVRLGVGDAVLRIVIPDAPPLQMASVDGFASETGLRYITLQVTNLDAIIADARARQYPVPYPPRETRPGTFVAMIEDGAGITVELQQTSD